MPIECDPLEDWIAEEVEILSGLLGFCEGSSSKNSECFEEQLLFSGKWKLIDLFSNEGVKKPMPK